jgi:hypothetical protein
VQTKDIHKWAGHIKVTVRYEDGHEQVDEFENLITDVGLDLLVSALNGVDAQIYYLAWGTSSTAPATTDTTLVAESGRKAVTSAVAGTTGAYVTTVYLSPSDANVAIEELGWFAGSTASATVDTGVMIARVLYSHTKSSLESITVERTDTLS